MSSLFGKHKCPYCGWGANRVVPTLAGMNAHIGKKTPDDIIALVGSKAVLSEAQKSAIRECSPADDMPGPDFVAPAEVGRS